MNTRNDIATTVRRRTLGLLVCAAGAGLLLTAGCGNKAEDTAATPSVAPAAPGAAAAPGTMNGNSASDAAKRKAAMEAAGGK